MAYRGVTKCDGCGAECIALEITPGQPTPDPDGWGRVGIKVGAFPHQFEVRNDYCPACVIKLSAAVGVTVPTYEEQMQKYLALGAVVGMVGRVRPVEGSQVNLVGGQLTEEDLRELGLNETEGGTD